MSSGYQQYGGNPYGGAAPQAGYGQSNPYASEGYSQDVENSGGGYGGNPYGQTTTQTGYDTTPSRPQAAETYSDSNYGSRVTTQNNNAAVVGGSTIMNGPYDSTQAPPPTSQPMSNQDFLSRVDGVKHEIRQLTSNIGEIGSLHQRILGSTDNSSSIQLENLVSQTQILNTQIKDQIKQLETDAARSNANQPNKNQTKDSQIRTLKSNFKSQLEDYQKEEQTYRARYKEQIARQYKIVNPEASDMEVREASEANWGDEGVFQTALKSNRTGAATSVLGSVRARHNDIQQIERTLTELNLLFQSLAEQIILQEEPVKTVEQGTNNVVNDTTQGNTQLEKGVKSARRARKLKWWCFFIVVLIIVILGLVLGLYFGLRNNK